MEIRQIASDGEKAAIARMILESLPDWFGIAQAREEYIQESACKTFFCAFAGGRPVGFLYLKESGRATVELYVMGVLPEYHRQGIGLALFLRAKQAAVQQGYSFLQVKTVQTGRYEIYDRINRFYRSLGFQEFEVFPTLWDVQNPCQVYVMAIP